MVQLATVEGDVYRVLCLATLRGGVEEESRTTLEERSMRCATREMDPERLRARRESD